MPTQDTKLDIAQRIAEHLARTSEPRTSVFDLQSDSPDQEPVGKVPMHLRHLHNLLEDLANEVDTAEREYRERKELMGAVRTLFFTSLKTHVPEPEGARGITISKDWSVVADMGDDGLEGLSNMLVAALAGGLRR